MPISSRNSLDKIIKKLFSPLKSNSEPTKSDDIPLTAIDNFRDRTFVLLTRCLLPVTLIGALVKSIFAIRRGSPLGFYVASIDLVIAILLIIFIVNKGIAIRTKKILVFGILYFLSIFLIISLGSYGPGFVYFLLLTVLVSLIFPNRVARMTLWLNFSIYIALGILISYKLLDSPLIIAYNLEGWIAYSINLMGFNVIIYLLVSNLIMSLKLKITQLSVVEARQKGLLSSQTNFVIRTDMDGRYTYANDKFIADFNWLYEGDNIIGQKAMSSILEYHHQKVFELIVKCADQPSEVFQVILDKPKKNGGVLTTLWEFTCIFQDTEIPIEIQCIGVDISARVGAEKQLQLTLEDLNQNNRELQNYAYVVSHNLRAPIANILGLVDVIKLNDLDDGDRYITCLKESAQSLDQVVRDLSQSIAEVGTAKIVPMELVDLHAIFSSIRSDLAKVAIANQAIISYPSEPYMLLSYRAYLYDIFFNIIYNGIIYKRDVPPEIFISVRTEAQYLVVQVQDNGTGIDINQNYDELFQPYVRLNLKVPGKGLGLFFVKRYVDALGGIILVESRVGIGSTFKVFFPMHERSQT